MWPLFPLFPWIKQRQHNQMENLSHTQDRSLNLQEICLGVLAAEPDLVSFGSSVPLWSWLPVITLGERKRESQ